MSTMRTRARNSSIVAGVGACVSVFVVAAVAQDEAPLHDLSREKVLYAVGYAHLDTQWRWDYPTTIDRYIRDTLEQNFERFEDHPGYVFNFTGSVRYEMMKEYYPEEYERLKQYIADDRWHVSGSSVDEGDANVPSPESMIRQVLYGNRYFQREFGKTSADFMLPDCFGFPASMPSIWAHCGLLGFSTQKLTWGSAVGIPFSIGLWEGPDGNSVIAALDPGAYVGAIEGRVDTNPEWVARVNRNGEQYGVWADYHYYGVGDQGGAPRDEDVANYLASIGNPDGEITVALASSDQMYKDITPELRTGLPKYKGDLLLTEHSAGTLTSQSYMKRWNRMAEGLADAAERAGTFAAWLGTGGYRMDAMERAWVRFLANQMHDILPGTSIPSAYTYSWNDEIVAMNLFAGMLTDAVGAIATTLDTDTEGVPLLVYNALAIEREDLVEATVTFDDGAPEFVRVFDSDGVEVPSQVLDRDADSMSVLFIADVAPVSVSVFEVRAADAAHAESDSLSISDSHIENDRYRIEIDAQGDVVSVFDKAQDRELLAAPARLVFTHEKPRQWPAWNMDWADRQKPPVGAVDGDPTIRIVEDGPVRVALEIEREARNSIVTQRIRLARGDEGRIVEFDTDIDWQATEVALKASFPLAASNPDATYNWGMGTIERGNNEPVKYEVPSHEWIDLTDSSGEFGVSILDDSKYGSDKPSDNEVRLTLLYTPGVRNGYLDQHSQDWGRHEMRYALYSHAGDWREGRSEWRGRRLNQPLRVFQTVRRAGGAERSASFASINTEQVDIRAIKRAEDDPRRIIVRLQELWGENAEDVQVRFAAPIIDAYEVDGQERKIGDHRVRNGAIRIDMTPFSPRTFSVELARTRHARSDEFRSEEVRLEFNADVISSDADRTDGAFDDEGRTIPAEMLGERVYAGPIRFSLGPTEDGARNAVECRGQTIDLPEGQWDRVHLLAAAVEDVTASFMVGDDARELSIQQWTGFVGQWDDRIWDRPFAEVDYKTEGQVVGFTPGYIKRDDIAWFATHRHHPEAGNEAYRFSYLFDYTLPAAPGASTLTLPDDPRIKIMAVTVSTGGPFEAAPAAPLYDDFSERGELPLRHVYPPPPTPVFEGQEARGVADIERTESFDALTIASPVVDDATLGVQGFRVIDPEGEWPAHWRSHIVDGFAHRLNDGIVAANDDDTQRCVWFDNPGRLLVDLGKAIEIKEINTFSWHRSDRAPQYFSVWGFSGVLPSDPTFSHAEHGDWELLGVVDTRELGQGGVHASSVRAPDGGSLGAYQHVLLVLENMGNGTFLTEIDIVAAE